MKATELRIGNLFNYHGQTVYVMSIEDLSAEFGYFVDSIGFLRSYMESDCPEPIPLTEERLLKFGFEERLNIFKQIYFVLGIDSNYGAELIAAMNEESSWRVYLTDCDGGRIGEIKEYIHELQNLYFALTGKELICQDI